MQLPPSVPFVAVGPVPYASTSLVPLIVSLLRMRFFLVSFDNNIDLFLSYVFMFVLPVPIAKVVPTFVSTVSLLAVTFFYPINPCLLQCVKSLSHSM